MFIDAVSDKKYQITFQRSDKISNTTMKNHWKVKLFFIGFQIFESLISKLLIKLKDSCLRY